MHQKSSGFFSLLSIFILILLSSCETDVELLAPYDETPVIYGVLDYTADTQFVRINKTFLGEGDPAQYSIIKDSIEYGENELRAVIYKYNNNRNLLDSFQLIAIDKPIREPGIFYNQDVRFYYTTEELLTSNQTTDAEEFIFELRADIREESYTSETRFPGLSVTTIQSPIIANQVPQRLAFVLPNQQGTFSSRQFSFITDAFSASYSATLRMNFDYVRSDGTIEANQYIDYDLGDFANDELVAFTEVNISVFGENLFVFIGNQLDLIPALEEVQIRDFEFRVTGATPELNTYLEVVQPVSQFTPVLNTFSNISNGAIGLFSSTATRTRIAYLAEPTLKKLNESPLTDAYNFCVHADTGIEDEIEPWIGTNYACN